MKTFKNILLIIAGIIACIIVVAWILSTQWSVIDKDKLAWYEALEQSKIETKVDTVIKLDTLCFTDTLYLPSSPILVKDTIVIADSTKLQELANLYMSTYQVIDTLSEPGKFELRLNDLISQNAIKQRSYDLTLFRCDTVFINNNNHITTISTKQLNNQIIGNWFIGSKHDFNMYSVTYLRNLSPNASKLQFNVGGGLGMASWKDIDKFPVMNLTVGVRF